MLQHTTIDRVFVAQVRARFPVFPVHECIYVINTHHRTNLAGPVMYTITHRKHDDQSSSSSLRPGSSAS